MPIVNDNAEREKTLSTSTLICMVDFDWTTQQDLRLLNTIYTSCHEYQNCQTMNSVTDAQKQS